MYVSRCRSELDSTVVRYELITSNSSETIFRTFRTQIDHHWRTLPDSVQLKNRSRKPSNRYTYLHMRARDSLVHPDHIEFINSIRSPQTTVYVIVPERLVYEYSPRTMVIRVAERTSTISIRNSSRTLFNAYGSWTASGVHIGDGTS